MADLSTRQDPTEDMTAPDPKPVSEGGDASPSDTTPLSDTTPPDTTPPSAAPQPAAESGPEPAEMVTDPPKSARRRPSQWAVLVTGLSALLVALLVGAVALLVHNQAAGQRAEQHQVVLDAARKMATDLTTISSENAEQQIESMIQASTGTFRDQISGGSPLLQTRLKDGSFGSTGIVTAAGIEKLEADAASTLVMVTTVISSSQAPQGELHTFRLAIQLQHDSDRWLVSTVELAS
ncbi:MAG: hypothetical protein ACRDRH_13405 [Pseudonocardia sp.]